MLSVSLPMLVVVLNDCVTETKLTSALSSAFDQLRKIKQRTRQPVDLVDHHYVDRACGNICQQLLERWTFQRSARDAAIIVDLGKLGPALRGLAQDIGSTCLALGIKRVEVLLQAFLARFASIDRTADLVHAALAFVFKPKKAGPDQRVPVIARATSLKERHCRSFQMISPCSPIATT